MKLTSAIILASLLPLVSCYKSCPEGKAAQTAIISYSKEVLDKHGWVLFGLGGSYYDNIVKLDLSFICDKNVDMNEARRLVILGANSFLDKINQDEKIKPYLNHYPFTSNDLTFSFSFENEKSEESISSVFLIKGKVCYFVENKNTSISKIIHREAYEDALKILENETSTKPAETYINTKTSIK